MVFEGVSEVRKTSLFERWVRKLKDGKAVSHIFVHIRRLESGFNIDARD